MKKKIFFIIFFFIIPLNSFSLEIAIVDIDYLINVSKKGKKLQNDLKIKSNNQFKKFKDQEKKFKDTENNIKSKQNVLSEEDYKKEVIKFTEKVNKYNIDKKKIIRELNNIKSQEIAKLLKEINNILIEYSKENKIITLMDKKNVIITKTENDITQEILKILDK
tara:strand:- start:2169 stop:2660 length:492 start_codon:yes stop_codon:yes gene_type:complete